jgi:oligopeptide/dipeptide ABC transporter ATP-binding protein
MSVATSTPLLKVEALDKRFALRHGLFSGDSRPVTALEGVSLSIRRGEIFGLVGESGSGKSTLARAILQLVRPDAGTIELNGRDLGRADRRMMLGARKRIQVIFQDPASALSPRRTILQTLMEPLDHFSIGARESRRQRCIDALGTVGLGEDLLARLPRQLSSGQRQRVGIARAILTEPELVVADEAVSALDVSLQAQVLELVRRLRDEQGIAFLFISHDLAVIHQVADRVAVMYRGQIVESGPVRSLFAEPAHPYTRELLAAIPDPDPSVAMTPAGVRPGLARAGGHDPCPFADRCPEVMARCREMEPGWRPLTASPGHHVKCHLHE